MDPKENRCVGGGFVGNNLEDEFVFRINYYCPDCLLKALYLDKDFQRISKRDKPMNGAYL